MPKDVPAGKTGLAEQRALNGTQREQESASPLEKEAGSSVGLQGCCEVMQGENSKSQSPARTSSAYGCKRQQKVVLQIHQQQKEGQGESPSCI